MQIPHEFLKEECRKLGFNLPVPGNYGVGMVFLPRDPQSARWCEEIVEAAIKRAGQKLLGWRTVPTNNAPIGDSAKAVEPVFKQVFIERSSYLRSTMDFERKLYRTCTSTACPRIRSCTRGCSRPNRWRSTSPT
jgi:glutamate synthase domain-containing protein 1